MASQIKTANVTPSASITQAVATGVFGVAWSLLWMAVAGWRQAGQFSAPRPFVLPILATFYVVACGPLVVWLGSWCRSCVSDQATRWGRWIGCCVGSAMGPLFAVMIGPVFQAIGALLGTDLLTMDILRSVSAFALMLPWGIATACTRAWPREDGRRMFAFDGVIVLLLAWLPTLQSHQFSDRRLTVLGEAQLNEQWVDERALCRDLADMGTRYGNEAALRQRAAALEQSIAAGQRQLDVPLAAAAGDDERIDRARLCFQLGKFAEARQLVLPLTDRDPRANVRLALISEWQGDWAQAAERYEKVLQQIEQTGVDRQGAAAPTDQQLRLVRLAMERRVNNLRRVGRTLDAERALQDALQRWPSARDALLMQLGYHYRMAGRHHEAANYFHQAVALNPQLAARAQLELSTSRNQAESCLFPSLNTPINTMP